MKVINYFFGPTQTRFKVFWIMICLSGIIFFDSWIWVLLVIVGIVIETIVQIKYKIKN